MRSVLHLDWNVSKIEMPCEFRVANLDLLSGSADAMGSVQHHLMRQTMQIFPRVSSITYMYNTFWCDWITVKMWWLPHNALSRLFANTRTQMMPTHIITLNCKHQFKLDACKQQHNKLFDSIVKLFQIVAILVMAREIWL